MLAPTVVATDVACPAVVAELQGGANREAQVPLLILHHLKSVAC